MLRSLRGASTGRRVRRCALVVALLGCVRSASITRALGEPLIWTDELSRFLMVWLAVFGWIVASRKRIHVRIRFFQDCCRRARTASVELAIQAAMTLFGILVTCTASADRQEPRSRGDDAADLDGVDVRPDGAGGAVTALQGATSRRSAASGAAAHRA
jgi:hypothetical protein